MVRPRQGTRLASPVSVMSTPALTGNQRMAGAPVGICAPRHYRTASQSECSAGDVTYMHGGGVPMPVSCPFEEADTVKAGRAGVAMHVGDVAANAWQNATDRTASVLTMKRVAMALEG